MKNLKKVISSVAALAIVASSASAFAVTFPDVDASASYANAVSALTALGVINGDDNGLFNPDNSVTRAEFTKMAVEALGEHDSAVAQTTSQFTDAANTDKHWAAGYIAQGVSDQFINGYDDTTFGPDDQVTYAQACKMLVAAIGYTTYAEGQGGWPTGYVAQASSLGVSKGVSASNDTNLTRQQCAVMIYNAMQVPLCVVDEYETGLVINTDGSLGTGQNAKLKKLDGKEGRDYQTLLTDRHDAYIVKGRVTETSQGADGLEKDEVQYQVEVADRFDDANTDFKVVKSDPVKQTMKVGDTDAASKLFEYTEALVQKDVDSDEFTILAITQYGNSDVKTFAADDVSDEDTTTTKLAVFKSAGSSTTTKYDLAENAKIYVNGVEYASFADLETADLNRFIYNNATGTVTIVDETDPGSTSTDGKYDYIMVDYYVDAVVESVQTSSSFARIYFKDVDNYKSSMKWDPDDEDIDITFTKDGQKIEYTDLQEFDVLSIAFNVNEQSGNSLDDLDYYDIKVSSNKVSGTVKNHINDADDNLVTIDGQDYDLIATKDAMALELSTEYTLYLDVFGKVAYFDEGNSEKNYGVIVAMYRSAGNDQPTVRMITSDAQVVAYECKDETEAKKFYSYATTGTVNENATLPSGTSLFTKSSNEAMITAGRTVCQYTLTSGKVKFKQAEAGVGGSANTNDALEFKASSSKLGSYTINETVTKLIDMDGYMNGSDTTVGTLSLSSFEDEAKYDAYLYGRNNNGDYRFAVVFAGTSSIRPDSSWAVVSQVKGSTQVDGTDCTEVLVDRDGQENISVLIEGDSVAIGEGAVIAYTVGTNGYVETDDLYVLYTPEDSYNELFTNVINGNSDTFNANAAFGTMFTAGTYKNKAVKVPAYGQATSKDVYVYFGPVYKKQSNNLELFITKTNGTSSINDTESFNVASANSYVYDYTARAKYKVSVASQTQATSLFNNHFADANKTNVDWASVKTDLVSPAFAIVKTVDNDVTDVIYFTGELKATN